MKIGQFAQRAGVGIDTVRYYERHGLLSSPDRLASGYRQYSERDIHTLQFIKRSRDLGFSMLEISELVSLWRNRRRTSASVKRIAQAHADGLNKRIEAMQEMRSTLTHLIHCCHGDQRPDCPILEDLASPAHAKSH